MACHTAQAPFFTNASLAHPANGFGSATVGSSNLSHPFATTSAPPAHAVAAATTSAAPTTSAPATAGGQYLYTDPTLRNTNATPGMWNGKPCCTLGWILLFIFVIIILAAVAAAIFGGPSCRGNGANIFGTSRNGYGVRGAVEGAVDDLGAGVRNIGGGIENGARSLLGEARNFVPRTAAQF